MYMSQKTLVYTHGVISTLKDVFTYSSLHCELENMYDYSLKQVDYGYNTVPSAYEGIHLLFMIPAFTKKLYQGNNLPVYSGIPIIEAAASAKIEVN